MSLTRTSPASSLWAHTYHHLARLGGLWLGAWHRAEDQRTLPGKDDRRVSREARVFIPAQVGRGPVAGRVGTSGGSILFPAARQTHRVTSGPWAPPTAPPCPATPQGTWQLQPLGHFAQILTGWAVPRLGSGGPTVPSSAAGSTKGCSVRGWRWGWGSRSPGHAPETKAQGLRCQRAGAVPVCSPPSANTHLATSTSAADGESGVFQQPGVQVDAQRRPSVPSGHRQGDPTCLQLLCSGREYGLALGSSRVWGYWGHRSPSQTRSPLLWSISGSWDVGPRGCGWRWWAEGDPSPPVGSSGPKCTRAKEKVRLQGGQRELRDQVAPWGTGWQEEQGFRAGLTGTASVRPRLQLRRPTAPIRPLPSRRPLPSFTCSCTNPSASQARASNHRVLPGPSPKHQLNRKLLWCACSWHF